VLSPPGPWVCFPIRQWLMLIGLGIIPTVMGHSVLNHCMHLLRGQTVSIFNLGQFVFAEFWRLSCFAKCRRRGSTLPARWSLRGPS